MYIYRYRSQLQISCHYLLPSGKKFTAPSLGSQQDPACLDDRASLGPNGHSEIHPSPSEKKEMHPDLD
jgi:hypothetical protein